MPNYAVSIRQRLDEPTHLDGYQISIEPTDDEANNVITGNRTIFNNVEMSSGIFSSLPAALEAIRAAIHLPFSVHQNAGSDYTDYAVQPISARATEYSRRIATVGRAGIVMHDAE